MPRFVMLLVGVVALAGSACLADDTASFLDRMVDAYGGEPARAKAATTRQTGTVVAEMRGKRGTVIRTFERPGRLRVEIRYEGEEVPEVRVIDGSRGWRQGQEVGGPMLTSMVLQAARIDLPWILFESSDGITDHGVVNWEGSEVRRLELALDESTSLVVDVDPKTAQIRRSVGRAEAPGFPGGALEFETRYDGFQKVDGVLVAMRETSIAMGHSTGETVLEEIEMGGVLGPDSFVP